MNIAVVFAGGVGQRMNSKTKPKQFLQIQGKPIIIHTLEVFEECREIDAIVVACVEDWIENLNTMIEKHNIKKVKKVVCGGSTGQASIYNGLLEAKKLAPEKEAIVLIHDGVRPLITGGLIKRNIESVKQYGSAITAVPAKETIIQIDQKASVERALDRNLARLAKAPQSFWLEEILAAHEKAIEEGHLDFIDSCTMMSYYGKELHVIDGPYDNIKVTTPEDFYIMRAILEAKENSQIYGY